jgi:ectoine hydroxylase
MKLSQKKVSEYDKKGWILLPELFSKEEIPVLENAAIDVLQRPGPEVARETDGAPHVC